MKTPKLFLAPMAGIADSAFRQICKRYGADVTVSEMISAKAVCFQDKKTFQLARSLPEEHPLLLQIFGSEPHIMARAAKTLTERFSPEGIDINMGCPVGKIVKNHEGSALMRDPELVYEIVARVREAVEVPVSVKIRSGRTDSHRNAPEIALAAKRGGASLIAVHGKTAAQLYAPPVCLADIRAVKEAVGEDVPVVGNGEIHDGESAKRMLEQTGCDHLMIGRAAMGRPWIFEEIKASLEGRSYTPPKSTPEILMIHLSLCCEDKGEDMAIREMRKHVAAYLKGFRGAAALRDRVNRAESAKELYALLHTLFSQADQPPPSALSEELL